MKSIETVPCKSPEEPTYVKPNANKYEMNHKTLEQIYNEEKESCLHMTYGEWFDHILPKLVDIEINRRLDKHEGEKRKAISNI